MLRCLATGLIVGILWGVWHSLWGSGTPSGEVSLAVFLPALLFYVPSLPAYRVLMVWVYDRTESLLVAMLMHASFSASLLILQPPALAFNIGAYLLWVLALVITLLRSKDTTDLRQGTWLPSDRGASPIEPECQGRGHRGLVTGRALSMRALSCRV